MVTFPSHFYVVRKFHLETRSSVFLHDSKFLVLMLIFPLTVKFTQNGDSHRSMGGHVSTTAETGLFKEAEVHEASLRELMRPVEGGCLGSWKEVAVVRAEGICQLWAARDL